jgi:anaerobic selenocysteine-containing dehydrogenase
LTQAYGCAAGRARRCAGFVPPHREIDAADAFFLVGHNVAETQSVLWTRKLDRLDGPDPPGLVVVDPRPTMPARRADVHSDRRFRESRHSSHSILSAATTVTSDPA